MILDEIVKEKLTEVEALKKKLKLPLNKKDLPKLRDFKKAVSRRGMNLIAETKAASPSAGVIFDKYVPENIAAIYERSGACAVSVLTDAIYFNGSLDDLERVKNSIKLPVLRKDFIIDESQIYESRLAGADAVLLIARLLNQSELKGFIDLVKELGMDALVEVHSAKEARSALDAGGEIIGINNRDLNTLKVDVNTTVDIINELPVLKKKILVSESGISDRGQVDMLRDAGVVAILVGEAILKSRDTGGKIKELIG
ncbi:MAG: indole-3-glycerol phosphate synthase TrpC [bacterium]